MRSEPSHRIDRRGMLDARPQCMSLRLIPFPCGSFTRLGVAGPVLNILKHHALRQQIGDRGASTDGTAPLGNSARPC